MTPTPDWCPSPYTTSSTYSPHQLRDSEPQRFDDLWLALLLDFARYRVASEPPRTAVGSQFQSGYLRNGIAWQSLFARGDEPTHFCQLIPSRLLNERVHFYFSGPVRSSTTAFAEWRTKAHRQAFAPNPATEYAFIAQWQSQYKRLRKLMQLPKGWDSEEGLPVSAAVAGYALNSLKPFEAVAPAPSFSTSGEGDIWALWAAHDLDIELRVRSPGDVFAMIEDARGELGTFEDEDPNLDHVRDALITLGNRVFADQIRTRPASDPTMQIEYSTEASGPSAAV